MKQNNKQASNHLDKYLHIRKIDISYGFIWLLLAFTFIGTIHLGFSVQPLILNFFIISLILTVATTALFLVSVAWLESNK